jgi:hypothetical protein
MADPTVNERLDSIEEVRKLAASEARAVARAENRKQRRNAVIGYLILVAGLVGVYAISQKDAGDARSAIVTSGKIVSVEGCNRDFEAAVGLRAVLVRGEAFIKAQRDDNLISEAAYKAGVAYYAEQKQNIKVPDCREVANVITDDPRKTTYPPPFPRYLGDGGA